MDVTDGEGATPTKYSILFSITPSNRLLKNPFSNGTMFFFLSSVLFQVLNRQVSLKTYFHFLHDYPVVNGPVTLADTGEAKREHSQITFKDTV